MKKQIKRITAVAAAAALAISFTFPAELGLADLGVGGNAIVASAESSGNCGDSGSNVTWSLDDNGTLTISGSGKIEDYRSDIDQPWYSNRSDITSVIIEPGVTSIGSQAFYYCSNLTSITIPSGLTSIGEMAFFYCSALTSVTIPNSVISIGNFAFGSCTGLKSITIPSSVTSIENNVFQDCTGLTNITVDSSNPSFCSESGVLFNKDKTTLIYCPRGKTGSYTIPDGVTAIEDYAFYYCSGLTSVTIPSSVTSIGVSSFQHCTGLTSITIPNSVTSITNLAFWDCSSLTIVYIPSGVNFVPDESGLTGDFISKTATKITYTVDSSNNVTITDISLSSVNTVDIPPEIDGKKVIAVDEDHRHKVGNHTCVTNTTPTCINKATCGICGQDYYGDHDLSHHDAAAHTCTADGTVEYWDCSVCGKKFSDADGKTGTDDIVDPAPGHNWDTAYDSNETHHWHNCTNANCPITEDDQKDGYAVHTPGAAATETTPQTCTECGYVLAPALGHIHAKHLKFVAEVPASCTTDGVKAHYECECGMLFSDADDTVYVTAEELKIAAHHTCGTDWESDNDENHYHVCSVCSGKADVTPHSYDSGMITTPATETTEGVKTYTCSVCNHTKTETVPKLSHTHSLSEDYSKDETGHWHTCSGCDEKVDFGAHIENSGTVTVQPTETSTGVMTYYCSVCGYEMRTEEISAIIPEHTHSYGTEWNSDSTSHWHECSCGDKTDIAQHISNGGVVTVQPTAYTTGVRVYSCSVCGYVIRTESIPATGSNYYPTYPTYPTNPTYPVISTASVFTENLTVKAESDGSTATLGWDKVENADKYYVYQYKDGKYVKIRTTTDTSVTLNGLKNGETYKFLVRYSIGGKLSPMAYSYKKTVKVYYKPIVKATSTENSIKLTWQAVPNAEKYAIYRYVDGKAVKLCETEKLAVRINKLTPDTEYQYIVRAYVDGEWTEMKISDIVTIKTKAE